jgi:phosphopantothenoylcysteine synthetase/decarboxylase
LEEAPAHEAPAHESTEDAIAVEKADMQLRKLFGALEGFAMVDPLCNSAADAESTAAALIQCADAAVPHIELRRWADLLIIAPCSANTLARIAGGAADNLLTCVARAWPFACAEGGGGGGGGGGPPRAAKPVLLAPAMNTAMWEHPVTAQHLRAVEGWGFTVIPPVEKRLVCGDVGVGAMAAAEDIAAAARAALGLPPL